MYKHEYDSLRLLAFYLEGKWSVNQNIQPLGRDCIDAIWAVLKENKHKLKK